MPTVHYEYGGSTAGRTISCPAWRRIAANMPRSQSSEFADRGTLLHDCMEALGKEEVEEYKNLTGKKYKEHELTEEMLHDIVIPTWEEYEKFAEDNNIIDEIFEIEVKDDVNVGGTVDVMAVSDDTIFILDWKFGHGLVSPVGNAQGLFYAMCAQYDEKTKHLFNLERQKLVIGIIQPAYADIGESIIQTWETNVGELSSFADRFYEAVDERAKTEEPCAGSHCKFCPAETICPIKTGAAREAQMIDPKSAEAAELAQAMAMVADLEAWCKSVRSLSHEQAELGFKINGFKLVEKRATRKWEDSKVVEDIVRKARKLKLEDAFDMKMKSPAALEKICKKKDIDFDKYAAYIIKVSTGTTLVHDSDKRPEVLGTEALSQAIASISE